MVRYTVEQRKFIVETYLLKRQNYDRCARKFRRRFPGVTVQSKPCVIKLFRKCLFKTKRKTELENEIRRVLREITERERERERERGREGERVRERELQKVFQNFLHHCDYCVQKGVNHFQHNALIKGKINVTFYN